jgi:ketosteroid isomerase-like protein
LDPVNFHPDTTAGFLNRLAAAAPDVPGPEAAAEALAAENLRRLNDHYQAIARADFDTAIQNLTEDVELELIGPPLVPVAGKWRGRAEVDAATQANYAQLADQRAEILAVTAHGDEVILFVREQGRVRVTGATYDILWSQQVTFRDGRIARARGVYAPHPGG